MSQLKDWWQLVKTNPRVNNIYTRFRHSRDLVQAEKTPFDIVYQNDLSNIRYYRANPQVPHKNIPIVLVAPLAVTMLVYDLFPERSLVNTLTNQGFNVYLIDWGKPTRTHTWRGFASYVVDDLPLFFDVIRKHAKQKYLTIHGWSLAGIFLMLYCGYFNDPYIKNLIILGSPVDSFLAGMLGDYSKKLAKISHFLDSKLGLHPNKIPKPLWHTTGWMNALGFKLLDPIGTLHGHISFLKGANKLEKAQAHATLGAFLNHMVDYPGAVLYDAINYVWLNNALANGNFPLRDKLVSLSHINCSVLAIAGINDALVNPESLRPLTRLVASKDTTFVTIPGGHVGIVSNSEAQKILWPMMINWLNARDDIPDTKAFSAQ